MVWETLAVLVTSKTAKTVARFLWERVDEFLRDSLGNKPSDEIAKLKKEVEDLRNKLESSDADEADPAEVNQLKEKVKQIEEKKAPLPAAVISKEVFQRWSEGDELDLGEQALIVEAQLNVLLGKAAELGIKGDKRVEIEEVALSIRTNVGRWTKAKFRARLSDLRLDKEEATSLEMALRRNLYQARDFIRGH